MKMDHRTICQCKTFRKNMGYNFCDLVLGEDFLDITPKARSMEKTH